MSLYRRRSDNNTAGSTNRLGALEARATKRANLGQTLYLPVIFIGYALLLGKCGYSYVIMNVNDDIGNVGASL